MDCERGMSASISEASREASQRSNCFFKTGAVGRPTIGPTEAPGIK